MSYIIGGKEFKTKENVKDYFKNILSKSKVNAALNKKDQEMVLALLNHHPSAKDKIGNGVDYIKVEQHIDILNHFEAKYPHFHIYRKDGSNIDFSYTGCINNLGKANNGEREKILKAFRLAVRPQIDNFRTEAFGTKKYLRCPVLGVNFSKVTCNIDHIPPITFSQLLDEFLDGRGIKLMSVELHALNGIFNIIKDESLRNDWINFHQEKAQLRAIHKTANLAQSKIRHKE